MEDEKKEPERRTLESFFASAAVKKQKAYHQSTSTSSDCMQQPAYDDVLPSSTLEAPILLTITDDECAQQSKSPEAPSPSSIKQLKSTVLSAPASQGSLIPIDISRSDNERPAQPKLPSYKKNKQNKSLLSSH